MNMKKVLILLLLLSVLAVLSAIAIQAPSEVPSAEFIAQALIDQEQLCGQSLDVAYTITINNAHHSDCRYVRTPDTLFLDMKKESSLRRCRLDRNSKESRRVTIPNNGGTISGVIDNKRAGELGNRDIPDPVRYNLDVVTLPELIRRGEVQADKQDIDGSSCWLIETPSKYMPDTVYRVWVDPTIGFCPRRIEISWPHKQPSIIDFLQYKDLGNGVWFPMEIHNKFQFVHGDTNEMLESVESIKDVKIDQTVSKSELDVVFPKGCHVYNMITDAEYVQP